MVAATPIEPSLEYVVTVTLIVADISRSTAFYRDVLGAEVLEVDEPTLLRLGNVWLTINVGGGPTDDKPEVIATAPRHLGELSGFLNLRVTDMKRFYQRCRARGAVFITEPKVHPSELRCYMRDRAGRPQAPCWGAVGLFDASREVSGGVRARGSSALSPSNTGAALQAPMSGSCTRRFIASQRDAGGAVFRLRRN